MLTIYGGKHQLCDGVNRRNFIKIGALGMGGLSFPQLLKAEQKAGLGKSNKAIIMIYLPGGPPHQDMYEIKTDAPSEIHLEIVPPQPSSASSGCGVTTIKLFGIYIYNHPFIY